MSGEAGAGCGGGERPTSWLGVIDLRGGRAVHAVAGRRAEYRPLQIAACPDADPLQLALHYRRVGVDGLYVADLDRILDGDDASQRSVDRLADAELPLWLDVGIRAAEEFAALVPDRREALGIVATETLRSLEDLRQVVRSVSDPQRLAVSLDLRGERVIARCEELAGRDPLEVARRVAAVGVECLVVLDVARVGTAGGPSTTALCRRLRQELPDLTIVSGGGIRGAADARELVEAGCDHVLAGTWLHGLTDGGLPPEALLRTKN